MNILGFLNQCLCCDILVMPDSQVAAEFDWSPQIQGHILGAFYYGYLLTQIPGGYIAARFGGKSLFGLAIMLAAILTLITPVASRKHWLWLFLLRLTEGICEVRTQSSIKVQS